ncbi:MAG: hypothetical protein EBS81_10230 [Gammaproteobacteria bacterium]|nr:hypothetical protein [Gammaproteobacteria bacterium]
MISAPIPPPTTQLFRQGIIHPDLFLWDSWCCETDSGIDLYCLALARKDIDGRPISPSERNQYFFHIRHFHSGDGGAQWLDKGCFQQPGMASDGHDARNIWSGGVLNLGADGKLHAYTGISQGDEDHPFIQSLAIVFCAHEDTLPHGNVILCPTRDREEILEAGYYLPDQDSIGSKEGEEGGPILAWRDPFLFRDHDGTLMMAWAAKAAPDKGAVGLASLSMDDNHHCTVGTLFPPITMPDDNEFTQLEVPKVIFDPGAGKYILCVSTTDRQSESQRQSEVMMVMRMYESDALRSGWTPAGTTSSIIDNTDNQFGMSVIRAEHENRVLHCLAPYTEGAGATRQLTFPPGFFIDLDSLPRDEKITALETRPDSKN